MRKQKAVIAETKNLRRLQAAYQELEQRQYAEGLALVYGAPGLGKTTAACKLFVEKRGILVTAKPGWRQRALLRDLLKEIGADPPSCSNAEMLDKVIWAVSDAQRPLFVDEADFLFEDKKTLETLRVIHDASGVPIVLIGMAGVPGRTGINRRFERFPQLADRISQWVEFYPCDLDDAALIADSCCAVQVEMDLLKALLTETKGNVRLIRQQLDKIQRFAKFKELRVVGLAAWKERQRAIEEGSKTMRAV